MFAYSDPKTSNALLGLLHIQPQDQIISVISSKVADGNFILTHLLKQFLHDEHVFVVLVCLHQPLEHYVTVGRKLGYDLKKANQRFQAIDILAERNTPSIPWLLDQITTRLSTAKPGLTYVIVDDLSHLLDLWGSLADIVAFTNSLFGLLATDNTRLILASHLATSRNDVTLSKILRYEADVLVTVTPLETGFSSDVTGSIHLSRAFNTFEHFHFKALDRGVNVFRPGESLYHLYQ